MLKRYSEFINESKSIYWLGKVDIRELFHSLIDNGYQIIITNIFYGYYGNEGYYYHNESTILTEFDIESDVIFPDTLYYPGFKINIKGNSYKTTDSEDLTTEFKSAISQLNAEGYIVNNIGIYTDFQCEFDIGEDISTNDISINGEIAVNDDVLHSISIYIKQDEQIILSQKDVAEIYDWKCSRIDGDKIYCTVSIETLAEKTLSRTSYNDWMDYLENGISEELYDFGSYIYDIKEIFDHILSKENKILYIKCLLKKFGIKFINKKIGVKMSENDIIDFLSNKEYYKDLIDISKDFNSDINSDIQDIVANYRLAAHISQNNIELCDAFLNILIDEGIEISNKTNAKVDNEYTILYELPYNEKWLENDFNSHQYNNLNKIKLSSIFTDWADNMNFKIDLNPNFSDYGSFDKNKVNFDIKEILYSYLRDFINIKS